MDIQFGLHGITFVWDREKGRTNPLKHEGITFEQAAEAFFDPFLKVVDASRNAETRHAIIGMDIRWNLQKSSEKAHGFNRGMNRIL